jgi:FdhE protein
VQSDEFLKAWREKARAWQAQVPATDRPDESAIEGALSAGHPLITLAEPALPPELFAEVAADLAGLLAAYRADHGPGRIAAALRAAGPDEAEALVRGVFTGNVGAWAEAHDLPADLLTTVASLALQPFMARFAASVAADAPLIMWRRNRCPICGGAADVCRIDPDNLRYLHCPQCDAQWEHHRLTCANCDTDDIKKVTLLTVQTMEPWRVELCDVCGGYTKSLDQRHGGHLAMPRIDLFLEDARTLSLDILAEERGYRREGRMQ